MSVSASSFTVVVPVFDRDRELRQALASVAAQTLGGFECVVVDDGSPKPLADVVGEFDERFVYLRNDANVGCTASRLVGYAQTHGEFVVNLDSDNELVPEALERAAALLDAHPEAAAVVGLYETAGRLRVRVGGGERLVTPDDYAARSAPPGDAVGVVRADVVREWLGDRPDFYNLDFALWLMLHLRHSVLFVDEVWGRYHGGAATRISLDPDPRRIEDVRRFVERYEPLLGTRPCVPLDDYLVHRWSALLRGGHREEARLVAGWLARRGVGRMRAVSRLVRRRLRRSATYVV